MKVGCNKVLRMGCGMMWLHSQNCLYGLVLYMWVVRREFCSLYFKRNCIISVTYRYVLNVVSCCRKNLILIQNRKVKKRQMENTYHRHQ